MAHLPSGCAGWQGGGGAVSGGWWGGDNLNHRPTLSTGGNEWIARVVAMEVCVSLCRTDRGTHRVMRQTLIRPPFEREHLRPWRADLHGSAHFFPLRAPLQKDSLRVCVHIWTAQRLNNGLTVKTEGRFSFLLSIRPSPLTFADSVFILRQLHDLAN